MINALVLAAGESRRMGMPKPLLRFPRGMGVPPMNSGTWARCPCHARGDTTFLEQIISVLRKAEVDRITVVLGARAEVVQASTDLSGTDVVVNENYRDGQLSSLIAGLTSLPPETEAILLCLVDNPLITVRTVDGIIGAFRVSGKPIVVPVFQGQRGHPALFARAMFEELLHAPADQGARYVVQSNDNQVFEVDVPEPSVLARIDTPEDYFSYFGTAPQVIAS
jgi:CTP:molybdopterin cytidylyltransferase MocA